MNRIVEEDVSNIIEQVGIPMNDFEGKEIVLSGAAGFLGNYFLAVFARLNEKHFKKPCKVIAIDNFISGLRKNIFNVKDKNIIMVEHDIAQPLFSNLQLREHLRKVDYIIHGAGLANPSEYRKNPIECIDCTVFGLKNLLEFARQNPVRSFLFFSSSEIYGNPIPGFVPTPEEYPGNVSSIGPRSCYDEAKRLGETMCSVYHRIHKIPIKTVRPFNVFGPGSRLTDTRLVPKFIYSALRGQELTIHLPGLQTRTLSYISDAMTGFFKAILSDRNGEVFNIGNDQGEINMNSFAQIISMLFNNKVKIKHIVMPTEYPADQAIRRVPKIEKAKHELLYEPRVDMITGLKRTIEWSKDYLKGEKI